MAYTISTELQNALDYPERYGCAFFTFQMGVNTYGLWTGPSNITYNSVLYVNGGSVLELGDIEHTADGSVAELELKLNANPDKGVSVDFVETFYAEDWQFARTTIQAGMRDPITKEVVGVVTLFRGVIVEAPEVIGPSGMYISARLQSAGLKLSMNGGGYRNEATQKLIDPTDTSMVGIGSVGGALKKSLKWGQG